MRPAIGISLLAFLAPPLLAQEDYVTITPAQPRHGEKITITYDPSAKGAVLKNAQEMEVYLGFRFPGESMKTMELRGGKWTTTLSIHDTTTALQYFFFNSGEKKDDNGRKFWDFLLYGKDHKPVKGAHWWRASSFGIRYPQDRRVRDSLMAIEYKEELALYPDNWAARVSLWSNELKASLNPDSLKNLVTAEFEKHLAEAPTDLSSIDRTVRWYRSYGNQTRAGDLENKLLTIAPKSGYAEWIRLNKATRTVDKEQKKILSEQFIADFPRSIHVGSAYRGIFEYYEEISDYEKMLQVAHQWTIAESRYKAGAYNSVAQAFADKKIYLDTALVYAERAIRMVDDEPSGIPGIFVTDTAVTETRTFAPKTECERNSKYLRAMYRATKGWAYSQKGMYAEAEPLLYQAHLDAPDQPDIRMHLAEVYEKNGKVDSAYVLHEQMLRTKPLDPQAKESLKRVYTQKHGSERGFDELVVRFERKWREAGVDKLASERVNKNAPQWQAKTLDGNLVASADYKDRVLVLTFWATWCGPCKAEFPYFQRAYNKFKDNPAVAFLAVNSSWSSETPAKAKTFLMENKYTIPAAFDEDAKVTQRFGVTGIPTTFLIDKTGKIQFKEVGFNQTEDYVGNLSLRIEELLKQK